MSMKDLGKAATSNDVRVFKMPTGEVSVRQKDILKVIADVNMLQGFPIQFEELKVWSADIERLSGAGNDELRFLFDCFKTNEIVWDRNMGIQNIFNGLKLVWNDNGILKLRKTVW